MKIINFEIAANGKKYGMVYDPYCHQVYSKHLEDYFSPFRDQSHQFQTKNPLDKQYYPQTSAEVKGFLKEVDAKVVVELTQNCNLRCKYCIYHEEFEKRRGFSTQPMSKDVIRRFLEFYGKQKNTPGKGQIQISFYGGEPSTAADLLYEFVARADAALPNREIAYSLTTNGTFYKNKKLIEFIKKHKIALALSLDGPKEENDKFRVFTDGSGSYDRVMNLLDELGDYPVMLQPALHVDHDWDRVERFIDDLVEERKNLTFDINFAVLDYDDEYKKKLADKLDRLDQKIEQKVATGEKFSHLEKFMLKKKFQTGYDFAFSPYWKREHFENSCYPGEERIMLDVHGDLHVCEEVETLYKIGNVTDGYDTENIRHFWDMQVELTERLECKHCAYHRFCKKCYAGLTHQDGKLFYRCDAGRKERIKNGIALYLKLMLLGRLNEIYD